MSDKKKISKKKKKLLEDRSRKAVAKQQQNQSTQQGVPFYHTERYLSPSREYVISNLTGIEMNIIRSAMLHYFKSNQDQALWEHMEKFSVIRNKIDAAKAVKATVEIDDDIDEL